MRVTPYRGITCNAPVRMTDSLPTHDAQGREAPAVALTRPRVSRHVRPRVANPCTGTKKAPTRGCALHAPAYRGTKNGGTGAVGARPPVLPAPAC